MTPANSIYSRILGEYAVILCARRQWGYLSVNNDVYQPFHKKGDARYPLSRMRRTPSR